MVGDHAVRCGVVGLGNIGYSHADSLSAIDHATLVGGVDVNEAAREQFTDTYGVPTFESLDALRDHGVDALIICTPNRFHAEYTTEALTQDIPVLCEKPLAHTVDDAELVLEAEADSDAFCMVGFNYRYTSPALDVVSHREDGAFGDITQIDVDYIRRRGVPGRGGWFTQKSLAGGGALIDLGVHAIDLALHIADYPEVTDVLGVTRSNFGDRPDYVYEHMHGDDHGHDGFDVDDSANAFIRCADGLTINLDVAWASNRPPSQNVVVRGTESGASFSMDESAVQYYPVNRESVDDPLPTVVSDGGADDHDSREQEQREFIDSVQTGTPPTWNTAEQAYQVQRIIDAIYQSSADGSAVSLSE